MTSRSNPSTLAVAVTPSDTVGFIQGPCRALYVGVAGNVSVFSGGAAVVFVGVQAGRRKKTMVKMCLSLTIV